MPQQRSDKTGGLALDAISLDDVSQHPKVWEKVVRKLVARQMPPAKKPRPDEEAYDAVVASLERCLDAAAAQHPDPGRTDTFRRLNRTEYQNAIRDLLALEVDATSLLPADESSHGFDNVTVGDLSPTLLDRYITAAQKISRLAVGSPWRSPGRRDDPDPGGLDPGGARRRASGRDARRALDSVSLPPGRRVRDPAPAGARPQRARRGSARAARAGGAARPRADGALHRHAAAEARIIASVDENLKARITVTAGPHDHRRDVFEKPFLVARNQAATVPGPLQLSPASADLAGALSRSRSPALTRRKGTATRPAAAGFLSASRRDRMTKKTAPDGSCPR